jgi:soluble lytic murein transglycosylase-like protein
LLKNYNEGWNAYHIAAAMTDPASLYPAKASLFANNYPPLSFFILGEVARFTGDAIIAGRMVAFVSTLGTGICLALAARAMGFGPLAAEIEQRGVARPDGAGLTRLRPASGFLVDPPLVYALVRRESNFDPAAISSAGARGLMQIMPSTAQAVSGERAEQLQDPAVNLAIGQQYLLALAQDDAIDGDLIRILASYGQGQGGLRKWVDEVRDQGDPLMFVEAIPSAFTRASVQDALVYYWHYAAQLHLPASSLEALAAGRYPQLVRAGASNANGRACAVVAAR